MKPIFQGMFFAALSAALPNVQSEDPSRKDWNSMEEMLVNASQSLPQSCVKLRNNTSGCLSSGILIDTDGTILTVSHAVDSAESEVTVFFFDGEEATAMVLEQNPKRDIAVLRINGEIPEKAAPAVAAIFESSSHEEMQPVVAVGFGGSTKAAVRFGFGYLDPRTGNWITTCRLTAGDSGGGLFSLTGELLAIHSATEAEGENRSHHIDLSQFAEGETTALVDASTR